MATKNNEERLHKLIDFLYANEWTPNYGWIGNKNDLQTLVTGKVYNNYHWISKDGLLTMRIKQKILTVHDAKRSYSKILSMKLGTLQYGENYIRDGNIALFLK